MSVHPDEARTWQAYRPEGAEVCGLCYTFSGLEAQEREAEVAYSRAMDPALTDSRPDRGLRSRLAALRLAIQRRCECSEGHEKKKCPQPGHYIPEYGTLCTYCGKTREQIEAESE